MYLEVVTHEPQAAARSTPLLFVHGAWHGAWCWTEYFLPYFAEQGYRSHAIDLRGHGKSEGANRLRWTGITHYVSDVGQTIDQLGESPVLIGHSMGGLVVQKYLESDSKYQQQSYWPPFRPLAPCARHSTLPCDILPLS